jgi:hypothetical protein
MAEAAPFIPEVLHLREHPRYEFTGRASVSCRGLRALPSGAIVDLSTGGCLIRMAEPLDLDPGTEIELNLQSSYLTVRTRASIRNTSPDGTLIGIAFEGLSQRARADILTQLADLEATTPSHQTF